jgi:Ca-activated chloride channel family protein
LPPNKNRGRLRSAGLRLTAGLLGASVSLSTAAPQQRSDDYRIRADVNLVVLHATVLNERGHFVDSLKPEHFRILEDGVEQKLEIFRREDLPVTVGLVIDNSGSMRVKRERVKVAALAFIEASNPNDEIFVVNFNDDYYLDIEKDFTNHIEDLREALERIDARGSTALYDALLGSLAHLKKGTRDKRVLLLISDGNDNASRNSLERVLQEVQLSDALIYTIGLFADEKRSEIRKLRKILEEIAALSGGLAYFPEELHDVEAICRQIAHDIRNQYTLAYYPTNRALDGTFRRVKVELRAPRSYGKLSVRTRTGYFAAKAESAAGAAQ